MVVVEEEEDEDVDGEEDVEGEEDDEVYEDLGDENDDGQ